MIQRSETCGFYCDAIWKSGFVVILMEIIAVQ